MVTILTHANGDLWHITECTRCFIPRRDKREPSQFVVKLFNMEQTSSKLTLH